jgi:hypothetical protein
MPATVVTQSGGIPQSTNYTDNPFAYCVECDSTIDAYQQSLDLEDVRGVCEECRDMGVSGKHEPRYLPSRHEFSRTTCRFIKDWSLQTCGEET